MRPNITGLGVAVAVGNGVGVAVDVDVAVGVGVSVGLGVSVGCIVAVGGTGVFTCLPAPHALNAIIAKNKITQHCTDPKGFFFNQYSNQPTHFSFADVLIRQRNL